MKLNQVLALLKFFTCANIQHTNQFVINKINSGFEYLTNIDFRCREKIESENLKGNCIKQMSAESVCQQTTGNMCQTSIKQIIPFN